MKAGCILQEEVLSDRRLVGLVQQGDMSAFTVLSERYLPVLNKRAGRYAGIIGTDIEDFVQEGLLALFRAVKGYELNAGTQFGTYAITCINNAMVDAIRAYMKNKKRSSHLYIDELDEHKLSSLMRSASRRNPVEDTYLDLETFHLRTRQIETLLSEFEQQVLRLYLGGHTYQQISSILDTATKAVDNALQRVRRKLRPEI